MTPSLTRDAQTWLRHPQAPRLALALWGLATLVITVSVLWDPSYHSIYYLFPEAAGNWWAGQPLYTPLIDFFQYLPQAAILTLEAIVPRPVVVHDAIAIRHMVNMCLSFDHRILDGAEAGAFMASVKAKMEAYGPEMMLG